MFKKRKRRRIAASLILVVAVLLIAGFKTETIQRRIGLFLKVETPLQKADLIYIFAGESVERPAFAIELYKKGYAPRIAVGSILVPNALKALHLYISEGELGRLVLLRGGVPEKAITRIPFGTSTYEEVVAVKKFMEEKGLHSVIFVSSPLHTRRISMTAGRIFGNKGGGRYYIAAVPNSILSPENWWKDEEGLISLTIEYNKLIYYFFKY